MYDWAEWLEQTNLASGIRKGLWFYPAIEIIHIIGFVILVGTAIMFDLRLLGVSNKISVVKLANYLLPWSRRSLLIILPSGFLLFMTNAITLAYDPVFRIKLSLIAIAGINALIFHTLVFKSVKAWDINQVAPAAARINAVTSIILWLSVICCGRLLAY